jgi:hypothetical protein
MNVRAFCDGPVHSVLFRLLARIPGFKRDFSLEDTSYVFVALALELCLIDTLPKIEASVRHKT